MITWGIARAGIPFNDFAAKHPKVIDWISSVKKPTLKQLEDFSHQVHLPFGYLFLQTPPKEHIPFPFFRTGHAQTGEVSLNVYDTISLIQRRQEWLTDYLKDNDFPTLPFVGKFAGDPSVGAIVLDIRNTLGLNEEWASAFGTWELALDHLSTVIEETGIFIT